MSYRVDIPTLSANEVYTLTFEYEGTETIQLIVGDLTLETTDRRVVFTTTSPVNYIESNVNLTNLNLYEGYYESDDFGGEYTQESYIEGKSLINLLPPSSPKTLAQGSSLDFDEETGIITITFSNNTNNFNCTARAWGFMKYLKPATYYTFVIDILENSLVDADGNVSTNPLYFFNTSAYLYPDTQQPFNVETAKGDKKGNNGTERTILSNNGTPGRYLCALKTFDAFVDTMSADQVMYTVAYNGTLKYKIMVIEGDYIESGIETNWFPQGIGCVKSPTIKSLSPENLYVSPLKYREPLRGYEYYHNDGTVEIYPNGSGVYSTIDLYTGEDVGMSYLGSQKTWYVDNGIKLGLGAGTYYFCCEVELVANKQITDFQSKPQVDVIYDDAQYFSTIKNSFTETYDGEKYYYKATYGASNKTVTDDIRGIYVGIWSYGIDGVEKYIIRNITLTREASLKDMCAISKSSIITTPDDLELHCVYNENGDIIASDKLNFATNEVIRNTVKVKLNDVLGNATVSGAEWIHSASGTEYVCITYGHTSSSSGKFGRPINGQVVAISTTGLVFTKAQSYYGWSYNRANIEQITTDTNSMRMMILKSRLNGIDYTDRTALTNWVKEQDFTMIIKIATPETEKLPTSFKPLKSYRNGSITTSSQQLTPTLKTTLPISNKFTTTNLTSGSTYNVYFDGIATKLDAGGTIITNPVSPCEVECGGTTLTIEGTDIQNVRVIETTVKNEVGSVCGTTDVELSRIITKCDMYNYFNDIIIAQNINVSTEVDYGTSKMIVTPKSSAVSCNVSQVIVLSGTYKFHCKVKVKSLTDQYKFMFSNSTMNTNDVTPKNLVEEINLVAYINCSTQAYFYALYTTNPVEYYDISLIKLSDEDITGTDTSSINYSQVTSDLEQPIKLRSLGTTYDSYNPVTGELIKRIGVSETDGSYSVLSSPIVENVSMGELVTNLVSDTFPRTTSNYTDFTLSEVPNGNYTAILDVETNGNTYYFRIIHSLGTSFTYNSPEITKSGITIINFNVANARATLRVQRMAGNSGITINNLTLVRGNYSQLTKPFKGTKMIQIPPQLYTNGQVKVYSESDVYPTTILNGQSTNNYEINELNTSNNYTIRYEGECESINLANKSNTQGNNVLVKAGATSGNLTFVNGVNIDNVMLVQNDVREQEINYFNGLQTVEVSKMLIQNQRNMFCINDLEVAPFNNQYVQTKPIPVIPNETIYCIVWDSLVYSGLQEYDENMEKLQEHEINVGYGNNGRALTMSDNTRFIIVNTRNSYQNYVMISRNGFLPLEIANTPYRGQYIDLPQPVQLNSLPDGTCDTYNPITGEYVQNVGRYDVVLSYDQITNLYNREKATEFYTKVPTLNRGGSGSLISNNFYYDWYLRSNCKPFAFRIMNDTVIDFGLPLEYGTRERIIKWFENNPTVIYYSINPIVTQLEPVQIPVFEGGILQLITTDGKVFPMVEYSMPTNNRYDTSSWETGAVYTQRNMTEAYFNESTTPMTPTETMTLTTDHISSGSIILNDNGNGLIVLKGNYTGRDIPYFTGMRSVEAIEVETTPSPDQPLFGKGGRK